MFDFTYYNPTRIIFGRHALEQLPTLMREYKRILFVYDRQAAEANDLFAKVHQLLPEKEIFSLSGVKPNPQLDECLRIVEFARENRIDFILGIGGGSVIDACKFVSAATASTERDLWALMEHPEKIGTCIPLGVVSTLPATGSEANANMVITHQEMKKKKPIAHEGLFPTFAIMNPEYTLSLPHHLTAYGIVDAFVHVLEQYLTYDNQAPLQDNQAEAVLRTLISTGPALMARPQDYQLRATVMWAALAAHNGIIACGVPEDWSTHRIGHELTALFNLPHAPSLAVILPSLLRYCRVSKKEKLLRYAEAIWSFTPDRHRDEDACIDAAIEHTALFFTQLGVSCRIADYGLSAEAIPVVQEKLQGQKLGEHGDINAHQVGEILVDVFKSYSE